MRRPLALLAGSLGLSAAAAPPVPDVPRPTPPPLKAAPLDPAEEARRDALARYGVGLIRARHDRIAAAAVQFEAAAQQTPTAAAPQKELARLYAELGREPAAVRAGEKALAADPNDLDTARLLGRLYSDARRHADAVRVLKLAAASTELTAPVSKLVVLKDLARAADAANDPTAVSSRHDALALIKEQRVKFLRPDVLTPAELERERARLYEGLGDALVRKEQYAAAVAAFEAARDLYANRSAAFDEAGVARLHWNLSGVRLAEGEKEKALAELEKYLAFRPAAFEPYERFVRLMTDLKRSAELPRRLAALADDNRKNLAPQWLAAAVAMPNRADDADELFRKLALKGTTADGYRVLVTAYRDADRPQPLLDILDKAYKLARPTEDGEEPKPDAKAFPDAVTRARLLTDAVKRLNPPFTRSLVAQAAADTRTGFGQFKEARTTDTYELLVGLASRDGELRTLDGALRAAVALRPKDYRLKWLTVSTLARLREWDTLTQVSERLSKSEAGRFYPSIVAQAAVAYAELGRRASALEVLSGLGETPFTQSMRSEVLNILGDHEAALKVCDEALKSDKLNASEQLMLLREKSATLNLLKRHAEAEAILRDILNDNPDDVRALNVLGYELAEQNRKLEEAETLIRRAVELDRWERARAGDPEAESGAYVDSLGWVLFRRGKLKEARVQLEEAVASPESNGDAIVWDHLGDVAFRQGEKKRAGEAWRQAAELYRGSHLGQQFGRLDEVKRKLLLVE